MAKGRMPSGVGGMNMNAMLKQAQKLQNDIEKAGKELDEKDYEFTSGGGAVRTKVNGKLEVTELEISPKAIDPEDAQMLSDMVIAAVNGALKTAGDDRKTVLGRLSGGVNLPGII